MLFRTYVARQQRQPPPPNHSESDIGSYLSALDRFYENEDTSNSFHDSLLVAAGSGSTSPEALRSSEDLHEVVKALREISREDDECSRNHLDPWVQLTCVALADARLLATPNKAGDSLPQPLETVSSEILDGYRLAKYQVENFGPDSKELR
jgi:hypothetical protein